MTKIVQKKQRRLGLDDFDETLYLSLRVDKALCLAALFLLCNVCDLFFKSVAKFFFCEKTGVV